MYPMSHKVWTVCTGVKEFSQEQEVELLFQFFMCLGNLFLMRERVGFFVLFFFSFFPVSIL